MIRDTITEQTARRFYDWLGARHDLGGRFEREAKAYAIGRLGLERGQTVLDLGCGTGAEHPQIRRAIGVPGRLYALDISKVMLALARDREAGSCPVQASAAQLPFRDASIDRVLSTYVFDLLPAEVIPAILAEVRRVLRPGGLVALVSLTSGVDGPSRAVVGAWQSIYRVHPLLLGGCRPVPLVHLVRQSGLAVLEDKILVQLGVPSAIVVARRT